MAKDNTKWLDFMESTGIGVLYYRKRWTLAYAASDSLSNEELDALFHLALDSGGFDTPEDALREAQAVLRAVEDGKGRAKA